MYELYELASWGLKRLVEMYTSLRGSREKELTCSRGRRCWGHTRPAGFSYFLQFVGISCPNSSKILTRKNQRQFIYWQIQSLTFDFILRRTELRSLSSTSFCLIFLTTSTSWVSAMYCLLEGDVVLASVARVRGVVGNPWPVVVVVRGGVPGGVVDSARQW